MKLIVVSGGFDPIHSGHIAYFKSARSYGDKLVVALNSDSWLEKVSSLAENYRLILFDQRGHGLSDKPHTV